MKVGVRIPCYRRWVGADEVREMAVAAEAMGYESLWVQDHLVAPVGSREETTVGGLSQWMEPDAPPRPALTAAEYYAGDDWWLDPYPVWAYLAAVTSRVRLCSDIVVIPYRNPVVQAKMLGTIDVLSKGRLTIGTGSGHVAAESAALGVDFDHRGDLHDEYLRVIVAVLGGREVSFEGAHYRFGPVRTLIEPVQRPHPPIAVGGNSRRAIRRAVEHGDAWLPSMTAPADLARGVEALHEECERAGRLSPPAIYISLPSGMKIRDPAAPGHGGSTAEDLLARLVAYEAVGVSHAALAFPMPDLGTYLRQLQLFADGVLPGLHG